MSCQNEETIKRTVAKESEGPSDAERSETEAERPKHPLEHTWSLWLYRQTSPQWGQGLMPLTSFATVEDFWCLHHHIKQPTELAEEQLSVFKQGVRPAWEHPANRRGGRWLLPLERRQAAHVNRIWTDMVLLMIGENFEDANRDVCGAVVNSNGNHKWKIAIWVTNVKNEKSIKQIGMKLKAVLNLPCKMNFHAHNSSNVMFTL